MYYPPRPIDRSDAAFYVWISGAEGVDAEQIRQWTLALADLDPAWIKSAFANVRTTANACALAGMKHPPAAERARDLEALANMRDTAAEGIAAKERAFLCSFLSPDAGDADRRSVLIDRVMQARNAEAIELTITASGHCDAMPMRLLHRAATDQRISPEGAVALRQLAIDNAARVYQLRLSTVAEAIHLAHRAAASRAAAESRGESQVGASAPAYRAVVLAAERAAELHRELLRLASTSMPEALASEIDAAYKEQAYDLLGRDAFSFDPIVAALRPLMAPEAQHTADELTAADRSYRRAMHDAALELFDRTVNRMVRRGRVVDPEESARFANALIAYHENAYRSAGRTIDSLAELARARDGWDEPTYQRLRADWEKTVRSRLKELMNRGVTSRAASDDLFDREGTITPASDSVMLRKQRAPNMHAAPR
ncbi:MAG: hypothetical protein U0625_06825 [Phycisphaerales bacterium]